MLWYDSCLAAVMSSHPTSIVILESRSAAREVMRHHGPVCEAEHVLCRDPGEPGLRFARRVTNSVTALSKETSLRRISYVASPGSDLALSRQNVLEELVVLLEHGGELELLARHSVDLIETVDPLVALAKTGVRVRALHPGSGVAPGSELQVRREGCRPSVQCLPTRDSHCV